MTLVLSATGAGRITNASAPRRTLPSQLDAPDCIAAWNFWTLDDSTQNARNLTLGGAALDDPGALLLTNSNAYAICAGLVPPPVFTVVLSCRVPVGGALFGNYLNDGSTETGLRIYTSGGSAIAQIGDQTGRASMARDLSGWFEIGVSWNGTVISICDMDNHTATGTETSVVGNEPCRFGRPRLGSVAGASGAYIAAAAMFNTAKSVAEIQPILALAKAKRLACYP